MQGEQGGMGSRRMGRGVNRTENEREGEQTEGLEGSCAVNGREMSMRKVFNR